jgi:hypothetical protein
MVIANLYRSCPQVVMNTDPRYLWSAVVLLIAAGCASAPPPNPQPAVPAAYAALPDSLVCVVDRAMPLGLRELPAKVQGEEIVILEDGQITPLEAVHPVNVIAGYAGQESWLTRGEPIPFAGNTFSRTGGERRVRATLLQRVGEHRGILLFAGGEDAPPMDALYVPTAPGCVFQPYVRQDLLTP